jgi:glycosyltransferase involved in cell wall biosynthesis
MPSLIESFGLVTVEAFAAGLPVVAMDAEGARDLLTESESTMLVQNRDPVAFASALLEMGRRVRKDSGLGQRNIAFAAQYDRRRIGERHVAFYQTLIDRAATRADTPIELDRAFVR